MAWHENLKTFIEWKVPIFIHHWLDYIWLSLPFSLAAVKQGLVRIHLEPFPPFPEGRACPKAVIILLEGLD